MVIFPNMNRMVASGASSRHDFLRFVSLLIRKCGLRFARNVSAPMPPPVRWITNIVAAQGHSDILHTRMASPALAGDIGISAHKTSPGR